MASTFTIRIERIQDKHWPGDLIWDQELVTNYEEWDELRLAEMRAKELRKQGARVEIYRLL